MKQPSLDRPRWTLRKRLLSFLLPSLLALLIISLVADYQVAFNPAEDAYDHALADDVIALADRVRVGNGVLQVDLPAAAEALLRSDSTDQEYFAVRGPEGNLLAGDADLQPGLTTSGSPPTFSSGTLRGKRIRKASYRSETPFGPVTVAVAETTHKRESAGSKILAAIIVPNVLLILATLGLVYFGVRNGLAPLNQLGEEIARRAPHDLSPLPKSDVPGEAEPLVNAISILIDDLRVATMAQQAFLADAAHQLKTPLAGLQTQLELTAAEIPSQYNYRVELLLGATRRLGHLSHQLLALARSGPEADIGHEKYPVDLAGLLEKSASTWYDQALSYQIDIGFELEKADIEGSEWLLTELVSNLVDNALQYTPNGGRVTVRSGIGDDGRPFLEVEDNGTGIAETERQRIFERFYRAPGSPGLGTGLGLAIVKEVADRHEAQIEIENATPAGGTRFRVSFPLKCAS